MTAEVPVVAPCAAIIVAKRLQVLPIHRVEKLRVPLFRRQHQGEVVVVIVLYFPTDSFVSAMLTKLVVSIFDLSAALVHSLEISSLWGAHPTMLSLVALLLFHGL